MLPLPAWSLPGYWGHFFTGEAIGDPNPEFLIVAFAGFVLGAIVTVVGLLLAGVGILTKQIDSPS